MISKTHRTAEHCVEYQINALSLVFVLALFATFALLSTPVHANGDTPQIYHLGIFPYMAPRQTVKYFGPIAEDMQRTLQHKVKLQSQRSFTEFSLALRQHAYDIALIQPFDYDMVVVQEHYIPLARVSTPLITKFYVRKDSPYHSLNDLRDTTLAMPPAEAAISRMALRELHEHHLVPGQNIHIRYFSSHDSCLQQVWVGNASACAAAPALMQVFINRMHANFRSIQSSVPIPHVLFVADAHIPKNEREKLTANIVGWSKSEYGKKLLEGLGFPGFVAVTPGEYSVIHKYRNTNTLASLSQGDPKGFVFGVFPFLSSRQLMKNLGPVLPDFSRTMKKPVRLQTTSTFGGFSDNLAAGKYDIVLVQPFRIYPARRDEATGVCLLLRT